MPSKHPIVASRPRGRPTKLDDPRMRERLIELIGKGVPNVHACAAVGISVPAFVQYRDRNEWFRDELATAIGKGIEARIKIIEAAAEKDWRAAAWWLEKCDSQNFGKNKIEVTGANGAPIAGAIAVYLPQKDGAQVVTVDAKQIEDERE